MNAASDEQVVLVDEAGRPVGVEEKLAAHRGEGRLHLAFSIYVFDSAGQLLLQRRAAGKYHFARLWSNTCCGHPRPGEDVGDAAERRLTEEFGFRAELRPVFTFDYRARDPASGLSENEFLHVFVGEFAGQPRPAPAEIEAWRWADLGQIQREIADAPEALTPWFRRTLERWPGSVPGCHFPDAESRRRRGTS